MCPSIHRLAAARPIIDSFFHRIASVPPSTSLLFPPPRLSSPSTINTRPTKTNPRAATTAAEVVDLLMDYTVIWIAPRKDW